MTTLTETAYYTRRIIKYGSLFIVFLILLRIAVGVGISVYRKFFPPPPLPPTVSFGKLPGLPFPDKKIEKKFSFSLQTKTGELPTLPSQAKVYFMPQAAASFLDLENAKKIASSLGYTQEPTSLSETIYRFGHPRAPATLDMNIVNRTFSLNYNLSASLELLSTRPRTNEEALSAVRSFLGRADLLAPDLETGEAKFDYLKVQAPNLVSAISLSEANFVRVNLFRQNYEQLPVLTPDRERSNVWFLVSGERSDGRQIIAGEYHYFTVDTSRFSTYPLKGAQQAWDELTNGKAFIASESQSANVTVRRVYPAYYDSGSIQEFLQPIIVFEGDENFSAYVPAITDEWYGQSQE